MNTDFKIKFDGEQHQIDATLLINNLIHTTSIIQELNRNLDSGKKICINIKALEKGSFLLHLDLIETAFDAMKNLLTRDNIETAGIIVSSFVNLIAIRQFLKGKPLTSKQDEGNKVKIENCNGESILIEDFVINIYENNSIIQDALSQSFETLENDSSITGYEITDKNEKPLIRVDRDDFQYMSVKSERSLEGEKMTVVAARLNIVRISFDEKLKSDLYYKGNKISVRIYDPEFQMRIDKGESFAKGDVLEVDLEIRQIFDDTVNTFVTKSYKINKINNHIRRDEQVKLEFDTE